MTASSNSTTGQSSAQRGAAVARRNLLAGPDSGGERAAAIDSLVGNARLSGIDPGGVSALHESRTKRLPPQPSVPITISSQDVAAATLTSQRRHEGNVAVPKSN